MRLFKLYLGDKDTRLFFIVLGGYFYKNMSLFRTQIQVGVDV